MNVLSGCRPHFDEVLGGGAFRAYLPTAALAAGTYPISYSYSGDSNFSSANDSSTILTVGRDHSGSEYHHAADRSVGHLRHTATFTAAASGTATLLVQWQVSTDGGTTFSNLSGAASPTLAASTTLPRRRLVTSTKQFSPTLPARQPLTQQRLAVVTANGTISGIVFSDFNVNGKQDSGEPALAGQTLFLDLKNDGTLDTGDPTATTNVDGNYSFTGLATGTYTAMPIQAA